MIQANLDDTFQDVFNKYFQKTNIALNSVHFVANGNVINPEQKVRSQMIDINNKIQVLVFLNDEENEENVITKSKDIICPKCFEHCRIKIDNYKIVLYGCINKHITNNIKIKDFPNTQKINESQIICTRCKIKNKGNTPENEFYKCLTCDSNLCLLCKPNHDKEHNIIKYDQKNYICRKHNDTLIQFCEKCEKNICFSCIEEHKGHKTIFLGDIIPNMKEKKDELIEIKTEIKNFNNNIKTIINQLNELVKTMEIYYGINKDILTYFDKKNRNFEILQNINEIKMNNELIQKLKNINGINNIGDKIVEILDLYNNINLTKRDINRINRIENSDSLIKLSNKEVNIPKNIEKNLIYKNNISTSNSLSSNELALNKVTMIHIVDKDMDKIKIFDGPFIKNNKNNCYMIINGEQKELCEYLELNNYYKEKNEIEIILVENKVITDMSYMCSGCSMLKSLPDIDKWDTKNVTNMSNMFSYCSSLKSLPDISNWNIKKVTDFKNMFCGCNSLKQFPDILDWGCGNNSKINSILYGCKAEIIVKTFRKEPSYYNNFNKKKIIYSIDKKNSKIKIFGEDFVKNNKLNCYLIIDGELKELCGYLELNNYQKQKHEIEIILVEIKTINDISHMFYSCSLLKCLPDIDKWETKNVTNMSYMFRECSPLQSLPDISNWNTKNVTNMSCMFYNCPSLQSLPGISKWDVQNVKYMKYMFYGCKSLISFPDISKWNTKNLIDKEGMFDKCDLLKSLPKISLSK